MNVNALSKAQPWGLTVLRIMTGIIFFMHGYQKLTVFGVAGFSGFLGQLGVPLTGVAAVVVIAVELLGGLALIAGLGTRLVSLPLAVNMLVALLLVQLPAGFFVDKGGSEFVLLLLAATIALFLNGSGALALENLLLRRQPAAHSAVTDAA
jgi:putative oxidoreductase